MEKKVLTDLNLQNNKLVQAGFEVVTALPTTNLFDGREVLFDTKKYYCVNNTWIRLVAGSLSPVAKSGSYNDLTDKPNLLNFATKDNLALSSCGALEISTTTNWFDFNCSRYFLSEELSTALSRNAIDFSALWRGIEAIFSIETQEINLSIYPNFLSDVISNLQNATYRVYVENDYEYMVSTQNTIIVNFEIDSGVNKKVKIRIYKKLL